MRGRVAGSRLDLNFTAADGHTKQKIDRRTRRSFTTEFKADAVRLVKAGKTPAQVAEDVDLTETALRE